MALSPATERPKGTLFRRPSLLFGFAEPRPQHWPSPSPQPSSCRLVEGATAPCTPKAVFVYLPMPQQSPSALTPSSVVRGFRFDAAEEAAFQARHINPRTCFMEHALVGLMYALFAGAALPSGVLLLTVPFLVVLWSLVLLRRWRRASPYAPQISCLLFIVGVAMQLAGLHWQVPLRVRGLETLLGFDARAGAALDGARQIASAEAAWPCVVLTAMHLQFPALYPYGTLVLAAHLIPPAAFAVAMALSLDVRHSGCILMALGLCVASSLWQNVHRTLRARREFMAQPGPARVSPGPRVAKLAVDACRAADRLLNHHLKNVMIDALTLIESFLQHPSGPQRVLLTQAQGHLRRGTEWCGHRLLLLQIVAAEYVPRPRAVNLRRLVDKLVLGSGVGVGPVCDHSVLLDAALCGLVLEGALRNARRHGHPAAPDVRLLSALEAPDHALDQRQRLVFRVTNRADPAKPRVPDGRLSTGRAASEARTDVLRDGSDGLGLRHVLMAADLMGMTVSLTQDDETVTFEAVVDAVVVGGKWDKADDSDTQEVPSGLTICCIDDSAVARRLVSTRCSSHFPDSAVETFGEAPEDVRAFVDAALARADIVILDQHLEYEAVTVTGTSLVDELLSQNFQGLVCMRSANNTEADVALYLHHGAHCAIDKETPCKEMLAQITAAYCRHSERMDGLGLSLCCLETQAAPEDGGLDDLTTAVRPSASRLNVRESSESPSHSNHSINLHSNLHLSHPHIPSFNAAAPDEPCFYSRSTTLPIIRASASGIFRPQNVVVPPLYPNPPIPRNSPIIRATASGTFRPHGVVVPHPNPLIPPI